MDKLIINGGYRLEGEIAISGAKNAALPILCTCLLTSDDIELTNVPELKDVQTMLNLLEQMGVRIRKEGNKLILNGSAVNNFYAPYEMVKTMRASHSRFMSAGCPLRRSQGFSPRRLRIGSRPVEQHIKGLRALGAEVEIEGGYILAKAKKLKGTRYRHRYDYGHRY